MEQISKNKFEVLSIEQMQKIQGSGFWKNKKTVKDDCGGSYTQIFNWFGLHGTKHLD